MERRLLAIVGPTATGKTETSILVAESLDGEIVSADSMQVYRGMDIGTAKPTQEQRSRVPHHLIDIIDPDEPFSVAEYQARADAALADIWARGRQPVLVGGSGLYIRAVLQDMDFNNTPADPEFRRRLAAEAKSKGARALHEWLADVDPQAAGRIHPNDEKRIIRALEVAEQRGGLTARSRKVDRRNAARYNSARYGLTLDRSELYRRIEDRVDAMIDEGLVEEVRQLLDAGYSESLVAMKGLGYAQIAPYVRGQQSLDEAVRRLKRDTRRFAKRQFTWFRADSEIEWIDMGQMGGAQSAAEEIESKWRS